LGARTHYIDGIAMQANPMIKSGINLNDLAILDTSRDGQFPLVDWVLGSAARQGIPAKIEKA
jgi:tetrathionate reductase subunit A